MKKYAIVAFTVPKPHSIYYKQFIALEQLKDAVEKACLQGANVISIREVEEE